tara:strand:+ start:977 stop:1264 length:288 start_codon:yes stop_codon:yes gene_type:complete
MSYAVISNINSEKSIDEKSIGYAKSTLIPMLKLLGAKHAYLCKTGENSFSIITIYPDEKTAATALAKQEAIREAASELPITLVDEIRGEIVASLE